MFRRTASLSLRFALCVTTQQNATFWGLRTPAGRYGPQIQTRPRLCAMHLLPKFHHPMFTRSEVIVLTHTPTNKQTPPKTSNVLRHATTLCNKQFSWRQCVWHQLVNVDKARWWIIDYSDVNKHWIHNDKDWHHRHYITIIKAKPESVSLSCKSHRSKTANITILFANSKHRS